MKDIKVSYLITSYNYEKYIKQAIDSVLNQSYKNIELIVIRCVPEKVFRRKRVYLFEK